MKLCGLQKTTLLDYPGHVAATVFTGGCNFNCPYCHNKDLISPTKFLPKEDVLAFLQKRRFILEGVCITGGEPTLQKNLPCFLEKIKQMGYLIKLDTNGYRPDVLKLLTREGLIDYVAMDVKTSKKKYSSVAGIMNMDINLIEESISFLIEGKIPHEFRTTVVRELHTLEDLREICSRIKGCKAYYLQSYQDCPALPPGLLHGYDEHRLNEFMNQLKPSIGNICLRGL